jgi:hypothetical protein
MISILIGRLGLPKMAKDTNPSYPTFRKQATIRFDNFSSVLERAVLAGETTSFFMASIDPVDDHGRFRQRSVRGVQPEQV